MRIEEFKGASHMIDGRVLDKPVGHASWGPLRVLYEWLKPATPSPHPPSSPSAPDHGDVPARIGHYAIERKLGQGGMGVVYAARDERLKRTVALKMMSSLANDERARTRFWREARGAASVNHQLSRCRYRARTASDLNRLEPEKRTNR
jgi:serine/threonine protein kinase